MHLFMGAMPRGGIKLAIYPMINRIGRPGVVKTECSKA
jgi:hypothetical protein